MSADEGAPIRSGLTGAEWLLIAEVLAALVALGIWWHQFSIHSPEYEVRMRAVKSWPTFRWCAGSRSRTPTPSCARPPSRA